MTLFPPEQSWWMACTQDPTDMLAYLRGKASHRQLMLFAAACCARVWHLGGTSYRQDALAVLEHCADGDDYNREPLVLTLGTLARVQEPGAANQGSRELACTAIWDTLQLARGSGPTGEIAYGSLQWPEDMLWAVRAAEEAQEALAAEAEEKALAAGGFLLAASARYVQVWREEQARQCHWLRDIFGNPWRPLAVEPTWLNPQGGVVSHLARDIYEQRRFDELPVLADALEEAGCTDQEILTHCRSGGEHVRGCWVLDLLLGKG